MIPAGLTAVGPGAATVLAALHARSFPAEERWTASAFAGLLALPGCGGLLDPTGGFVLGRVAADEAEILTLAVLPERRRRGLGRALLAGWQAEAVRRGASRLFLEVAADNVAAQALYAACQFTEVGRRRRYYPGGGDALVLACVLAPAGA